ncbi:MAG TPA: hypothetical protein VG797_08685, partial [Phycisphaerales bacterium]|nr:hypothetical protein [Phycisphaerales bacterium]
PVTQDESLVTRARKLSRADSWIDVREPADVCRRRIHAFNPWPGVDALINNEPVKLLRARVNSAGVSSSAPTAGHISPEGEIITGEGDAAGVLQILELQPSGGKPMPWSDFARGRHLATETGFSSSPPQGSGGV